MTRSEATAFVEAQFKGVELFKSKVAAPASVTATEIVTAVESDTVTA
jgi:hypothetical protein